MSDRRESGFKKRVRLATARKRLLDAVAPIDRTETLPVASAIGRVLADPIRARRPVPHYRKAAMDGYAVRAVDTFEASDRSPVELTVAGTAGPGRAIPVHTGSPVPEGADAVVKVEATRRLARETGQAKADTDDHPNDTDGTIEVRSAVAEGANVAPVGEDVAGESVVFEAGRRLRPSDPGLATVVGTGRITVYQRPEIGVVPTGDELVASDPGPGEVVESNCLTVSGFVERWGGRATYRDIVADDRQSLRVAIERDLTKDIVVTTGGTSVGERDLLPDVVADLGDILAHGLAIKPGHPVGIAIVRETPVILLPGYPVSCLVTAVQLLRPALQRAGHVPTAPHPTTRARLDGKIASEPGVRAFVRVALDSTGDGEPRASPIRAGGAGVLSSVAAADGWVVVPEDREGVPADEQVAVEHWEYQP